MKTMIHVEKVQESFKKRSHWLSEATSEEEDTYEQKISELHEVGAKERFHH